MRSRLPSLVSYNPAAISAVKVAVELEGRQKGAPTIAYLDSDWYTSSTKGEASRNKDKWIWEKWEEPSLAIKKRILVMLLREQVKVLVTNHIYTTGAGCTTNRKEAQLERG